MSADVRPLTRLTLSGIYVHWSVNASDSHPRGGGRKNESECVKEVANGSDCGRRFYENVP